MLVIYRSDDSAPLMFLLFQFSLIFCTQSIPILKRLKRRWGGLAETGSLEIIDPRRSGPPFELKLASLCIISFFRQL
jgi:hypothetical protein